jgi:hypothetical protein
MRRLIPTRRAKFILSTTVLAVGLTAWITVWGADPSETREIKAQLLRQAQRIQSLDVSYKLEAKTPLKPDQLLAMNQFRNQISLPQDEWRIAFKGTRRYSRQLRPERMNLLGPPDEFGGIRLQPVDPKAPEWVRENQKKMIEQYERAKAMVEAQKARGHAPRPRDPNIRPLLERDVTRAFNGHTLWMRRPRSEKVIDYQVWPAASEANWFQVSAYQSAVGLHVPDPTAMAMARKVQSMFQAAEWVKDHSYELEEKTEVVDGSTCVILKGSLNSLLQPALFAGNLTDRIWLDRDHGLALRRREFSRDGRISMRWENSELREVEPGLWLPTHCRHDAFADDAPPEWKGKPVMTEEIRVEKIEINHVPDGLFDMTPQKGDHIEDLRGILREK